MASANPISGPAPPYKAQDLREVAEMVSAMRKSRKDSKGKGVSIKSTEFEVKGSRDGLVVESWRMHDWDYKRRDLPTYARGLFTSTDNRAQPEIVVRGYDKFFNVGEVRETEWDQILQRTRGPYELTLKENGCIIFIAGLKDDTLLVCSKHSTGERSDTELSHAIAGERHLEKQLRAIGRTKAELARELRRRNVTAVAELCDDEFEEHILAYGPEKAGLYLHGLNLNLPEFSTYPSTFVQQFSDEWGFVKTGLMVMDDIHKVKEFLEEAAVTGAYDGRDIEGFVIRCQMSHRPDSVPYHDWFFKFKFEEPYLMYRQWRECTKALISAKPPRFKKHAKITEEYLLFARKRLAGNPSLAKLYVQNHGIIGLRNEFLEFKQMNGAEAANLDDGAGSAAEPDVVGNVILTPIATLGCGKTTLAQALLHLYKWGHIQNDNISGKGRPPRFVKACLDLLKDHPVVIADRNNAQKHERKQLITDIKIQHATVKIVALHFVHDQDAIDKIRQVTIDRVVKRGDNHQTIHAGKNKDKFIGVMEGFIKRFEPCQSFSQPDDGFDAVIDLDPTAGSRTNLEVILTQLHAKYPNLVKEVPSAQALDEAIAVALEYKPDFKHEIPDRSKHMAAGGKPQEQPQKPAKVPLEYMSVELPTKSVDDIIREAFRGKDAQTTRFYSVLKNTRRIQSQFHVTLMHRASHKQYPDLWKRYTQIHDEAAAASGDQNVVLGGCGVILERIVFDARLMAIVVRLLDEEGRWTCVNKVAHITVGTALESIKPRESNDLLEKWLRDGADGKRILEVVLEDKPKLLGSVRGVCHAHKR